MIKPTKDCSWAARVGTGEAAKTRRAAWGKALLPALLAMFVLVLYPERLIQNILPHLLTVIVGVLVLFVPMPLLLNALVPSHPGAEPDTASRGGTFVSARRRWSIVLALGTLVGTFAFIGEMSEGTGSPPLLRLLFVASVFLGLSLTGLAIAYTFLGTPLGLGARD